MWKFPGELFTVEMIISYSKITIATCWTSIISCRMLTISVGRKWFLKIIQFSIYDLNKWEFKIIGERKPACTLSIYSCWKYIKPIKKLNSYRKNTYCIYTFSGNYHFIMEYLFLKVNTQHYTKAILGKNSWKYIVCL